MVRIEESKRLLINTDYSIIDIALATGFEDQSYFSKVFKNTPDLRQNSTDEHTSVLF